VIEVTPLSTVAKQLDYIPIDCLADEPGNKTLAIMRNQLAGAVDVGQSQAYGPNAVNPIEEQMVVLSR
jgi:hypothetical protein